MRTDDIANAILISLVRNIFHKFCCYTMLYSICVLVFIFYLLGVRFTFLPSFNILTVTLRKKKTDSICQSIIQTIA